MNGALLDRLLVEREHLRARHNDPALASLGMAILIEDVFGITLTDEQISQLRDYADIRDIVLGPPGPP